MLAKGAGEILSDSIDPMGLDGRSQKKKDSPTSLLTLYTSKLTLPLF